MKKLAFTFVLLISGITVLTGQTQQGINYQAVVRDDSGDIVQNHNISMEVSIISDSITGTLIYKETHSPTTNEFGLINIVVGNGSPISGNFSQIDWSGHIHFIRTDIELFGGTGFEYMGTSQFNSVPYSYYAETSGDGTQWGSNENDIYYNGGNIGIGVANPNSKLEIRGNNSKETDTLFQVKDASGRPVFAVFPSGVHVWVNSDEISGGEGSFVIGGISDTKSTEYEYFRLTPDSVRFYLKGGTGSHSSLAVGGISDTKTTYNNYFTISGESTLETIDPSEPHMLWYPTKNAFLSGQVIIEGSDSVGMYSMSSGYESKAMGQYSHAMGNQSVARANNSIAIGDNAVASGENSVALGSHASTNNKKGAFVYADFPNIGSALNATSDNQFMTRAKGGLVFHTDSLLLESKTVYIKGRSGYLGIGVA
ncbi:MAG: hypothetical protein DRJ05_07380, partial [Bacteroidetes bacterium]